MIHILDAQTDELKGYLDNQGAIFWDDYHEQDLDGVNTFEFTTRADSSDAQHIDKRTRLLIPADSGGWMEFITHRTLTLKNRNKEVHAVGAEVELNNYKIIDPGKYEALTVESYMTLAVEGTGYEIGQVDYAGIRTLTFDEALGGYYFLRRIATAFELELRFRVETKGGRITGRYVDMVQAVGLDTKKEIVHGKDLLGIERTIYSDRIVTALYCIGPEKDDGTRLTTLVTDEEAFQRWNREGRHIIDIYEPESDRSDMTLTQLQQYGRTEINKRIDAVSEYAVDFATLEHLYPHETVLLGDKVRIKDTEFVPPLYAEARILNIKRSLTNKSKKESVIGNVYEIPEKDVLATFKKMQDRFQDELSKLLIVSVESSAGDVFKNGKGITTLTADLRLVGQLVDVEGTEYTYYWKKLNKNGIPVSGWNHTGKSLTVTADEIDEKATYAVDVIKETVLTIGRITITNVFDGSDGTDGIDGKDGYTPVKGTDYFDGADGQDGKSSFLWVRYSQNANGNPMTTDPTGAKYIGVATTQTATAPAGYASYTWSLIKGDSGIPGEPGSDGRTSFLHVKYSNDGGKTFTADNGKAAGDWLGTYVDFTAADSNLVTAYTWNKVKGDPGKDGVSITKVDVEYYLSTSSTTQAGGTWSTTAPAWVDGRYMWSRTKTTYSTGVPTYSSPAVITGGKGGTGSPGSPGKGVVSITEQYNLSTSKSTPNGTWVEGTAPTWTPGKYMWTRSKIVYSNPTSTEYTTPLCDSAWEAVNEIEIDGTNTLINSDFGAKSLTGWSNNGSAYYQELEGYQTAKLGTASGIYQTGSKEAGVYTFSFMAKAADSTTRARIGFLNAGAGAHNTFTLTTSWKRYTFTTSISIGAGQLFHIYSDGKPYNVTLIKLERGNIPTGWSPAPEDAKKYATDVSQAAYDDALKDAKAYQQATGVQQGSTYNGVSITNQEGFMAARGDAKVRTLLNATTGILIQSRATPTAAWKDVFKVDTAGKLQVVDAEITGKLVGATGSFSGTISASTIVGSVLESAHTTPAGPVQTARIEKGSILLRETDPLQGITTSSVFADALGLVATDSINRKTTVTGAFIETPHMKAKTVEAGVLKVESFGAPLWEGVRYPSESAAQNVVPSKKLSECTTGWVIRWQGYIVGTGTTEANYYYTHIHKSHGLTKSGRGVRITLPNAAYLEKYIYVYDDKITGHANNGTVNSSSRALTGVFEY